MTITERITRGLARAVHLLGSALAITLIVSVALMLICIVIQVVMRYVFSRPPSWTDEMAILMFAWMALGGLAYGVYGAFHVRLTFVVDNLPSRLRDLLERTISLTTLAFGAYLAYSGARFVEFTTGGTSAAVQYPIELLHAMAPLSGGLIVIFALARLIRGHEVTRSVFETEAL
jgi:TRAP-type C4-dicarboxylate transport system permease small subunit